HYYNLPSGADFWSGNGDDFIARFPDAELAAGEVIFVAAYSAEKFEERYPFSPDYSLINGNMLSAKNGENTIGTYNFIPRFSSLGEVLVLFYWDGSSATVQDVDYLIWGSDAQAVDKSGVTGYQNDTPAASQSILPSHLDEQKLVRIDESEGTETTSGGNGIAGHDETSENLADTWTVGSLIFPKPKITDLTISPLKPSNKDNITFSCTVSDSVGLSSVVLTTICGTDTLNTELDDDGNDSYSTTLNFLSSGSDQIIYFVTAVNTENFETISTIKSITLLVEVAISTIQQNLSDYINKIVNVSGMVISRADNIGGGTNLLLDDGSGTITVRIWNSDEILVGASGLVVNEDLDELLQFGNRIKLSATVDEYNGDAQLIPSSAADFSEWVVGSEAEGKLTLDVAPYPFVPQFGEVIKYSVQYPENARIILRVYDFSGRFMTTLMDEHHGLSWQFDKTWNG
ncbi:MAG: OB-fold nucleic acid binding domain-containing protein, partial [Candidatus Marinimicrobia bacterium]|nr:OB-fold nucleic acid binding domain-containing protein [Candidatus Neomarinimicrobiota bacterium]